MFACIYCRKTEPEVSPSSAHIFPSFLGGVTTSNSTVCGSCNHIVNREVESPANGALDACRIVFNVTGRRRRRGFSAKAEFGGEEKPVRVDNKGEPIHPVKWIERDQEGRKVYGISGPPELAEAERQKMSKENPNIQWKSTKVDAKIVLGKNFWSLRRLAAKVAFERWAQKRRLLLPLDDPQYNDIRDFILQGNEERVCCGFFPGIRNLMDFYDFSVPYNTVVLVGHPDSPLLTAIVSFYGLFYLWVFLSIEYKAIDAFDYVLSEHPKTGEVRIPKLKLTPEVIPIALTSLVEGYCKNEAAYVLKAKEYAEKKFEEYRQGEIDPPVKPENDISG